jgi:hypothetical protein
MRIGSLEDLYREPGLPSASTMRRIIRLRPDFPFIRAGARGCPYQLDLDVAGQFVREAHAAMHAPPRPPQRTPEDRRAICASLGLEFAGWDYV